MFSKQKKDKNEDLRSFLIESNKNNPIIQLMREYEKDLPLRAYTLLEHYISFFSELMTPFISDDTFWKQCLKKFEPFNNILPDNNWLFGEYRSRLDDLRRDLLSQINDYFKAHGGTDKNRNLINQKIDELEIELRKYQILELSKSDVIARLKREVSSVSPKKPAHNLNFQNLFSAWRELTVFELYETLKSLRPYVSDENEKEYEIIKKLIQFIYKMQQDAREVFLLKEQFKKNEKREDRRTNFLYQKFEVLENYRCGFQARSGSSTTGKTAGIVDFSISDGNNKPLTICEAFNLETLNKGVITDHLKKIFFYNEHRLNFWFIIVYCEGDFQNFHKLYEEYLNFVRTKIDFDFKLEKIEDISGEFGLTSEGLKIALSQHFWDTDKNHKTKGFHLFLDISGTKQYINKESQ